MRSVTPGIPPHIALNRQDVKPLTSRSATGIAKQSWSAPLSASGLVLGYGGVTVEAIPRAVEKLREVMKDL